MLPQKNKRYGLIGKSLSHSFSRDFFTDFFLKNNIDARYQNIEISSIQEIQDVLEKESFTGLNVTIPYKEAIIPYLDELDDEALQVQSVNTIKIRYENGQKVSKGYNTDIVGFRNSIKPFLKNHHERALILGTGGASKAISFVLEQIGIDCLFVSRTPSSPNQLSYAQLNQYVLHSHFLIVNTSPVGTFPKVQDKPELPYEYLSEKHLCYDLIYNPAKTAFLKAAEKKGASIQNGLDMLKIQALEAWKIWQSV